MQRIEPTLTRRTPKARSVLINPTRLRELMNKYQKTQVDVAKAVGVSQPAVAKWLAGGAIRQISLTTLAARFGVKPEDITRMEVRQEARNE